MAKKTIQPSRGKWEVTLRSLRKLKAEIFLLKKRVSRLERMLKS